VNSNVAVAQATTQEAVLPQRVQEALGNWLGQRGRVCSALSVGVGLGVLSELMERRSRRSSPEGPPRSRSDRGSSRSRAGEVTLGGAVSRFGVDACSGPTVDA